MIKTDTLDTVDLTYTAAAVNDSVTNFKTHNSLTSH